MDSGSIDITISVVTNTPQDAINQNELLYIYEELKTNGANLVSLESDVLPGYKRKAGSSEIDILIGAVHIVLFVSTVVAILVTFIKKYFDTLKSKRLKIKKLDGTTVEISGYNGKETDNILQTLLLSNRKVENNKNDSDLIQ